MRIIMGRGGGGWGRGKVRSRDEACFIDTTPRDKMLIFLLIQQLVFSFTA